MGKGLGFEDWACSNCGCLLEVLLAFLVFGEHDHLLCMLDVLIRIRLHLKMLTFSGINHGIQLLNCLLLTYVSTYQIYSPIIFTTQSITVYNCITYLLFFPFLFCLDYVIFLPPTKNTTKTGHPNAFLTAGRTSVSRVEQCMSRGSAAAVPSNYSWTCNVWEGRPVFLWRMGHTHITFFLGVWGSYLGKIFQWPSFSHLLGCPRKLANG